MSEGLLPLCFAGGIVFLLLLILLRRPLAGLFRLLLRSGVGLALLAVCRSLLPIPSLLPGLNPANALVLGLLGVPGFGLLFLLTWLLGST